MKTLLIALLVAASGFASAPMASADGCAEKKVDLTIVDVYTSADCTVEVVILEDLACLWGTTKHSTTVGPVTVSYYSCSGADAASPSASVACLERTFFTGPEGSYVSLHADCTVDVVLLPDIVCVGGDVHTFERVVGPVRVEVHYCGPHSPPPKD